MSLDKGLNALFSGLPGTKKTMAAEAIARELQLDLYKIALSPNGSIYFLFKKGITWKIYVLQVYFY